VEIEAAVKPLLAPMVVGQPLTLDTAAEKLIATWTMKAAAVYQLTTRHRPIQPSHFRALYLHRRPPAGVQVWVANRAAEEPLPSVLGFRASALAPASETHPRFHAFLVTLAIGTGSDSASDPTCRSMPPESARDRDATLSEIWPSRMRAVSYPGLQFKSFAPLAEDPDFERHLERAMAARGIELRLAPSR
jgi:hypothetical protein